VPVILLVRHGRSALSWETRRLTAVEFRAWVESYQQYGIAGDSVPSDSLIAAARAAAVVVCSDVPRGVESARRVAEGREVVATPLLREAGSAMPGNWMGFRLSTTTWDWGFHYLWLCGLRPVGEPVHGTRQRAREACTWLESLAREQSPVLVVAHWTINRFLAAELRRRQWLGPRRPAGENWGVTRYVRDAASPG
jgi:broad specificity phosphatase PhoE